MPRKTVTTAAVDVEATPVVAPKPVTKRKRQAKKEVTPTQPSYCFDLLGGTEPYLSIGIKGGFEAVFTGPVRNFDGSPQTPVQAAREMRKSFFDRIGVMKHPLLELPTTLGDFMAFDQKKTFFLAECVRVRSGCTFAAAWEALGEVIPEISSDYWHDYWFGRWTEANLEESVEEQQ